MLWIPIIAILQESVPADFIGFMADQTCSNNWQHGNWNPENVEEREPHKGFFRVKNVGAVTQHQRGKGCLK